MPASRVQSAALIVLSALWGCAGPEPQPLDPVKSEAEFRSRTLDDPGLKRFAESNGISKAFPPSPWDLPSLTLVAFYFNPDLDVARARLVQGRAGVMTAGMWPNPTLGATLEKAYKVEPGLTPWVYAFNLSVPLDALW